MAVPKNEKPPLTGESNNLAPSSRPNVDTERQKYAEALQRIIGLAKNGAMLGHDHAYDACCKIEAIAAEALRRPSTPHRPDDKPTG